MAAVHASRPFVPNISTHDMYAGKANVTVDTSPLLDFDAAQEEEQPILSPTETPRLPSSNATRIISSPYKSIANQLNVTDLDTQSRLLSLALTQLVPIRSDYATADYLSSFNWGEVFSILRELCARENIEWQQREFYLVIFRSKLRATANRDRLGLLDRKSHEEACASGGLLRYWFGKVSEDERRNLATCVWRNREDAFNGGRGPWHRQARGAAREMYEQITFHTHRFIIDDEVLSWRLEDYKESK